MTSDKPEEEAVAVMASEGFELAQTGARADVYIALIDNAKPEEYWPDLLAAIGRALPIIIITWACHPCPSWMLTLADRWLIAPPGLPTAVAAQIAAKAAEKLLAQPWSRRRLN